MVDTLQKDKCVKLDKLAVVQRSVIKRHLPRHQWIRHFPDELTAFQDFVQLFGPIMREIYCETCEEVEGCQAYKSHLEAQRKLYKEG
jgi:hypothetical protein